MILRFIWLFGEGWNSVLLWSSIISDDLQGGVIIIYHPQSGSEIIKMLASMCESLSLSQQPKARVCWAAPYV